MRILIRPLLLLFLTISFLPSICQVIDATICDSTSRFPITKYSYFLRTTKPITIDSAVRSQSAFIKANNEPVLVFNYDPYYYWFRIVVKNPEDESRKLMLLMAPVGMYEGRLFQKINGKWDQVAHGGLKYKFQDRSYQFNHYVFPFTLAQRNIDTLYISIDASNVYKTIGFSLLKPKELKIFEDKIYFVFGIIVGLLILFFVLNVSLFFALKEKLHLWYALYIALLFLVVMKNDQLDQEFLGLDSETTFRLTPFAAIGALAIAVLLHVVQSFLKDILIHNKLLYRLSIILKINVLCSAVVHAFVFSMVTDYRIQSIVFSWLKISFLFGICIIIVNCLYCIKKGFKSALFIFFGSLVFMIGSVQRLFFPSTLSFMFPPTTFHIGIILEVFIISMGIIYRYWSEKVLERKKEAQMLIKEEQIQIQTLHDISGEIHDGIAPILTLANLHLRTIDFDNVNKAIEYISNAIGRLRGLSRTLKNESVAGENIAELIKTMCLEIEKTDFILIESKVDGDVLELEGRKQAILIRIINEALENVIMHSRATKVEVLLIFKPGMLSLKIHDNGIGFDLLTAYPNSNGLKNIKNRCLLLNATCHFKSEAGFGTEISIHMPV